MKTNISFLFFNHVILILNHNYLMNFLAPEISIFACRFKKKKNPRVKVNLGFQGSFWSAGKKNVTVKGKIFFIFYLFQHTCNSCKNLKTP